MNKNIDLDTLIFLAENFAEQFEDGHLTIMKFTTEWKVMLGTPNLDSEEGRKEVSKLNGHKTLEKALLDLILYT